MDNQPDWDLIGRYMAGEATADEQVKARQWLEAHPEDARLLGLLDQAAPAMAPPLLSDIEVETALRKVRPRHTPAAGPRFAPHHRWLAAAVVIAGLGLWTLLRSREHVGPGGPQLAAQISTTAGQVDTLFLDDGSRVILAPNSRVSVAGRSAVLHGQAYFDVVHNESKPFTVRTNIALVRDLGTSFDVMESVEGEVLVDVVTGEVDLRSVFDTTQSVVLRPGDRGEVRRGSRPAARRGQVQGAPPWTTGQLVFQNASMSEVRNGLHRWYGISLQVHDSVMADRHITATFRSEPVDQVLHIIALAVGGTVERRGNAAILHSTPSATAR